MSSEKIININTGNVRTAVAAVKKVYEEIEATMKQFNTDKEESKEYWIAKEADKFREQMDVVSTNFENFQEHYSLFMTALDKILVLYDEEEQSIWDTINGFNKSSNI